MIDYIAQKTKNVIFYITIALKNPVKTINILFYLFGLKTKPLSLIIKTFWDSDMKIVIPDVISSFLYLTNHFEVEVEQALLQYLKKGDVFVDVGAHYGYFSLLATHIVGDKGHVYSFEPTPSTYKILVDNLHTYPTSTTINKAVYSKNTIMNFYDFGVTSSALNSLYSPRTTSNITGKTIQVKTTSLDNFFQKIVTKPDFIKIDAESAEYDILTGMTNILRMAKPIISIERPVLKIDGVASNKKLFALLEKNKYKAYQFVDGKFKSCDPLKVKLYNILFLPNNTISR